MAAGIPRINLHLRLQHLLLIASAVATLTTGAGLAFGFTLPGVAFDLWYRAHVWGGFGAAGLLAYHVIYLFVRGYVEGKNWPSFPLAWHRSDWAAIPAAFRRVALGGETAEGGFFRTSQKSLYWGSGLLIAGLTATGVAVGYWETFGAGMLPAGGPLAHVHRGLSLLLFATILWHLYGVFLREGRWSPQWSWLTGTMSEEQAKKLVPDFYREYRRTAELRRASVDRKGDDQEEEEKRLEKQTVEQDLEEGNRLAREEKFVDSLYHYRRALEKYPGYSQARYNMAVVLRKMGERAMAVDNFKQFLREDPFHPLARRAQEFIAEIGEEEK